MQAYYAFRFFLLALELTVALLYIGGSPSLASSLLMQLSEYLHRASAAIC